MKCPQCDITLSITERQGIEIDYCPNCRGIWLDRGELDKLIERSALATSGKKYKHDDDDRYRHHDDRDRHHGDHDHRHYGDYDKRHKKKSFLDDLFDF